MNRVLIFDDRYKDPCGLRALLEANGFIVDTVRDVEQALAAARLHRPVLAISELSALAEKQYALLSDWRSDKALHDIPMVVCTAHDVTPDEERRVLSLGVDELVSMPIRSADLLRRIRQAADGRPTAHEGASPQPSVNSDLDKLRERASALEAENARITAERRLFSGLQGMILDVLPAQLALLDADGNIFAVNEAWRQFASENGLKDPNSAVGSNYLDICNRSSGQWSAEAGDVAAGVRAVLAGQRRNFALEYPCHSPDESRWFRVVVTTLRDIGAEGALVTHVNITEIKMAQEASRRDAERLALALEAGKIGFWERTLSTEEQVWNDRMYQIYGLPLGTLINYPRWASMVVAGWSDRMSDELQRLIAAGGTMTREIQIRTGDGKLRDVYSAERLLPAASDNVATVVGINIDITERRQQEVQIAEINSRLETLVNQARVGILVHHDFKPLVANDELARIFGLPDKDAVLRLDDCRSLFAPEERARVSAYNAARHAGTDVPGLYMVKGIRADGTEIDLENRAFRIQWGKQQSVCAMLTDVTEQRQTERQLRQVQRLEAIGQLSGGIAHDFNNLLTVILGNSDLIAESLNGDADLRNLVEMTKLAAQRGAELTNRLLAFSRQQALDPKSVDVKRLIADINGLLQRAIGEDIEIRVICHVDLGAALVDLSQLESAILNLAVNARDAMPSGGRLTIEASNVKLDDTIGGGEISADPGEYVLIAVSDNGSGMDETTRLRAFDPFFTTKEVGKGSGLGLSMVYGFVQQSKGVVRIYSEVGVGTTVKLYLPAASAHETKPGSGPSAERPAGGSEKILVVEDHDMVREQAVSQLKSLGYRVMQASDGAEAIEALRAVSDIDLLFTDVVMPGKMNGKQLAEAAQALRPGLPVLFTSGYSEDAIVHQGRLDDGVLLLSKPYRRQDLATKIRMALSQFDPDSKGKISTN